MTLAFRLFFCVAFGSALWLSLMPIPPAIAGIGSDPMKHAVGWAGLTLLMAIAYRGLSATQLITLIAVANLATEVLQGVAQIGRNPDALDWVWGMVGTLIIAGLRNVLLSVRPDEARSNAA